MANFIFGYLPRQSRFRAHPARPRNFLLILLLLPLATTFGGFPNFANFSRDRTQGEALYQQAYTAYRSGDYSQALRLAEQADKLKPDQADGWNLRGIVLLKQKSFEQAEAAFTRAAACDPDMWATQFNLAEVPYQKKDYARARTRFERLLAQTDRYKESRKWEMVLYKTFLSYLFVGDEAGAKKKLAKLSAAPGTNPVLVYADAAVAFQRKDAVGAQKMIAAAQAKFPQETNDLFSEPLVQAGWITMLPPVPAPLPGQTGMLAVGGAGKAAALGAATGVVATPGGVYNNHQPVVIDPRLEAAAAEPLPEQDGAVRPMLTKVTGTRAVLPPPAVATKPTPAPPRPAPESTPKVAVAPLADTAIEHGGLLLE